LESTSGPLLSAVYGTAGSDAPLHTLDRSEIQNAQSEMSSKTDCAGFTGGKLRLYGSLIHFPHFAGQGLPPAKINKNVVFEDAG
jgi:hypothetical protein